LKLKLDENLGQRSEELLVAAGHDVSTVRQQHLQGIVDADLIERCRTEVRGLVTLDLGFANPLTFLPSRYAGIAVLRLPERPSAAHLATLVRTWLKRSKPNNLKENSGSSNRAASEFIRKKQETAARQTR
jgi:predicted nuclease of predicted toxin-antitoxin system